MEERPQAPGTVSPDLAARFVVGIDLGTTNIAVSYVDTARDRLVRSFAVPQLTGPGETSEAELLPAFCYLPAEHELPEGALALPWDREKPYAVGVFARDRGAATPGRLVASAKSWLAHGGVDRTRGILPWGGDLGEKAVSPVAVTACYLEHLRRAWDARFAQVLDADGTPCRLSEQHVIITVPASFDEVARRLTLEAAAHAGIGDPVLLEEPLAAFYDWLQGHETTWAEFLGAGAIVLIVDVGGGTTDFSLVCLEGDGVLRRTAVGEHLLLGGDNMDMALAREVEQGWGESLPARQWSQLCQACRQVKETLMAEDAPERHVLTIAAPGSAVVGSTRTWTFSKSEVRQALLEGFFPALAPDAPPPTPGAGIRQMGLPYASDPAITRHLLAFLRRAGLPSLTHVLFNGGALMPALFRERLRYVLGQWLALDGPLPELRVSSLRTAVAGGAAYYGLVRRGAGVRVRGGAARSYYVEARRGQAVELVCVLPRDTDEGQVVHLSDRRFRVVTNRPVRFALHASSTRVGDLPGQVVRDRDELTPLPPVQTVLVHGRRDRHQAIDVKMHAVLTEIGTLDLWCTTPDGRHRYPLSFDLRAVRTNAGGTEDHGATVQEAVLDQATRLLDAAFADRSRLKKVMRDLEGIMGSPRGEWGGALLRRLADWLLDRPELRTGSPEHEARWLNLAGYFVRPGYGFPGDAWRVRRLWRIWPPGPGHARAARVTTEWWVCWRRAAGGLRAGQQQQIAGGLLRELLPKGPDGGLGPSRSLAYAAPEMWRCLGALERVPVRLKLRVVRGLTANAGHLKGCHWWALARLGARRPMYGPLDAVIRAADLAPLFPKLFEQVRRHTTREALFALAAVCRLCGVRDLDISAEIRDEAAQLLAAGKAPAEWLEQLSRVCDDSREYQAEFAGDSLPLGLDLVVEHANEDGQGAETGGPV